MDRDDDIDAYFKDDGSKIRSLDLPVLKKIMPLLEHRHKKDSEIFEKLVNNSNQLRQTLGSLEIDNNQLDKSVKKKYQIYEELEIRGTKAERKLNKIKVMCPIYETKMNKFLDELSGKDEPKIKKGTGDESTTPTSSWLQLEETLIKRKKDLEGSAKVNQEKIDKFVEKYLN
ncbi:unnamed protein product [Ceutorhynchus assimilis]|uniref:Uncharacterized protein n=1 Tax=Ceutorhynchus assimilis TaxID=467358 RepID=A0A9N9QP02_9CUCU|nr:unnamed protein product [Ceutorhynchus assimilis]